MKKSWSLVAQHHEYTLLSCILKSGDSAKFYVTYILSQLKVNKRGKTIITVSQSCSGLTDSQMSLATEMIFVS